MFCSAGVALGHGEHAFFPVVGRTAGRMALRAKKGSFLVVSISFGDVVAGTAGTVSDCLGSKTLTFQQADRRLEQIGGMVIAVTGGERVGDA